MCRIAWLCVCLLLGFRFSAAYAGNDRPLFRIDGEATSPQEFVYYYTHSPAVGRISSERFFSHFLFYKLKVADAKRQGWDTLADFRLQCHALRHEFLDMAQKEVSGQHSTSTARVKFRQISFLLPQHASDAQEFAANRRMDSVCMALRNGSPFGQLAQAYSLNSSASPYRDGEWIPERCLIKEFAERLDTLEIGTYSAPFRSPLGIHIVCLSDREQPSCLPETGHEASPKLARSKMSGQKDSVNSDTCMGLRLISDGLLATYWDWRHGGIHPDGVSDKDLEDYFKGHKEDYAWDLPHFKGGVVHCASKKVASKLKRRLKRTPIDKWEQEISALTREHPEWRAAAETGLFQIGANAYVDKLAFKCGSVTPRTDLPYAFVIGKRLKKGPDEFSDVRDAVLRDYRLWRETAQMEELKRHFEIEINQDVLKTVNCIGKK